MKAFNLLCMLFLCHITIGAQNQRTIDRDIWIERYLSVSYPLKTIKVTSSYGKRRDPFTGKSALHSGIDLSARYEDVYSMFDGKVIKVGRDSRSGKYVIMKYGKYTVSYCHLSKISVRVGDKLIAGDVIGFSGNSGRSTGPHLHLTCKSNGVLTNPYMLLLYIRSVKAEAMAALNSIMDNVAASSCEDFIKRHALAAMEQQQKYGIPASVTLAQMAYESGWGKSTLARNGNNYFGIKCSMQWLAEGKPYSLHDDDKPKEKFCNYSNVEESIEHHSQLLMSDRYKICHSYSQTDYHNWLLGLKKAGYATASNYVQLCERIIKRYKLYKYDKKAMSV